MTVFRLEKYLAIGVLLNVLALSLIAWHPRVSAVSRAERLALQSHQIDGRPDSPPVELYNGIRIKNRQGSPTYHKRELLVRFKGGVPASQRSTVINRFGRVRRSFPRLDLYHVNLRSPVTVRHALSALKAHPKILYAEPNYVLTTVEGPQPADTSPDDPRFSELWGLHNTGQTGGAADADIDAPAAWDITQGSRDVVVAVIDTGVDYNHPDLSANMWVNQAEANGTAGVDDDGNGYVDDVHGIDAADNDSDPMDGHGHGTHVAGTIGAVGNNGVGVVGVNWHVQIMALKFLASDGTGTTSGAIEALDYAMAMKQNYGVNVVVTSNSWGGGDYSQALYDAIAASREANILFTAAAGNDTKDNDDRPFYPAGYDLGNIIAVAATDHNDALASFSNWGATTVDVAAPGLDILSTTPGNTYESWSGTSMATPHVSGLAALIASVHPDYTWSQIRNLIFNTADRLAGLQNEVLAEGRMNAHGALACSGSEPMKIWVLSPAPEFQASDALSTELEVLVSQCANPVTDAAVTASFDNGESDLALTHGENGVYHGLWEPSILGNVLITIQASSTSYDSAERQVGGVVIHLSEYTSDEVAYDWIEISATGVSLALGDDEVATIVSPFEVTFFGQQYQDITIGSNGHVNFEGDYLGYINTPIPAANTYGIDKLVATFWDDLIMQPARETGLVYTDVLGQAPQRQLVIEWKDVGRYGESGTVTFEVVFYENRPDILIQYQDVEIGVGAFDYGASATVGVQYNEGWGTQFSYDTPALHNQMALRLSTQSATDISDIHVTNVRDTSFSISWLTDQPAGGEVRYGPDSANLEQTASDVRGTGTNDETHYVTLTGLTPSTTYYFDVISNGTVDNNGGAHHAMATGPTLGVPSSDTIYGQVYEQDGTTPAEDTVVYVELRDADGSGSSGQAATLSALVDGTGYWSTNLGNARLEDLSAYFDYSASGDEVYLEAQNTIDSSGCQTVDTAGDTPAVDIFLNLSACEVSELISLQTGWNYISMPLDPVASFTAEDVCIEINSQGGDLAEIDRWYAGGWEGHICGLSFNDFPIEVGSSYFANSSATSIWTVEGYRLSEGAPLDLQIGWNSIGVPHSDTYTAQSLCDEIIGQGVTAVEIDRWYSGGWEGHICGLPFNDFGVERGYGYFAKAESAGTVTPTMQTTLPRTVSSPRLDIVPRKSARTLTESVASISEVLVTNVRDTTFTVSWTTDQVTTGEVHYGTDPSALDQSAFDVRGASTSSRTHYVTLLNLAPDTTYYFDVVSGSAVDDKGGSHYHATTGPTLGLPASDMAYGQVFKADGATVAEGTIVYVRLFDDDEHGSGGQSALLSGLVDSNGYWYTNLGNARTADLNGYFDYSADGDRIELIALGVGERQPGGHVIDTASDSPAAPIVLGCPDFVEPWSAGARS